MKPIQFEHEARRYRAEVLPMPGAGVEFSAGAWFVSVDGGTPRRVFEAQTDDVDTPAFRHRLLIATWLAEGWERRSGAERRKGSRQLGTNDRRTVPKLT